MTARKIAGASFAAAFAVAIGCSSDPVTNNLCSNSTFSSGGSHSVGCPGVSTCSCAAPNVCCMGAIDSRAGACVDPRDCGGLILSCDGPEDCNGGVCCLSGTGSSCTAAGSCTGQWLCRGDSQCAGSPNGGNCVPADFATKGVNTGLDGIIGLCQH